MQLDHMYTSLDHLPASLPIFPLPGAVLLPGGDLPLNIFEPRYLKMLSDSLATHRLIGMIQPRAIDNESDPAMSASRPAPELFDVGCAGRITSFNESGEGQVQIILSGVCRFRVAKELQSGTPYRTIRADYAPFRVDLEVDELPDSDSARRGLLDSLARYLDMRSIQADWEEIEAAPTSTLINTLIMIGSFSSREKQAVLEAADLRERTRTLTALSDMAVNAFAGADISSSLQ